MTTMYLVTAGSYSDYRVLGVYDTPEKAERARVLYDADDVEEFQLNEMPETPPGLLPWRVVMTRDGAAYLCVRESAPIEPSKELRGYGGGKMAGTVYAADEKHAVKIINEMRIQALALGRWPPEQPDAPVYLASHRYEYRPTKTSAELHELMMAEPDPIKRAELDGMRLDAMEVEKVKIVVDKPKT